MKDHTLAGKITYWIGFLFFVLGVLPLLGTFEFSPLVPSRSLAIAYLTLGIALLISSNFFKKK